MMTLAPASARASAQARPMAPPPPVTRAVRPVSLNMSRYMALLSCFHMGAFAGRPQAPLPGSTHPVAAIDIEGLGDDVVGIGRREKDGSAGVILGAAHAAIGHRRSDETLLLADRTAFVPGEESVDLIPHRRVEDAPCDRIDVDPLLYEIEPGRLCEADDGGLCGAIGRDQRLAAPPGLRGHVDDLAAAPLGDHPTGDGLEGEEQTLHVDREEQIPVRLGDFDDWRETEHGS